MKKLTKSQLKKIAKIHAGGVLLATEAIWAFESSNLSQDERDYLDKMFEEIALKLLHGHSPLFDSKEIVEYVRKYYK